jgi:hypothetical protein
MSYTRQQWATDFLKALGNSNPDPLTVNWVVGWTRYETSSGGGAQYNLLNTTQHTQDSTNYNLTGVQNFTSYQQGVQTNAIVLNNGRYPQLFTALRSGNIASLENPNSEMVSELKTWGTGYKNWGVSGVGGSDTFTGSPTDTSTTSSAQGFGSTIQGTIQGIQTTFVNWIEEIGIFVIALVVVVLGVLLLTNKGVKDVTSKVSGIVK